MERVLVVDDDPDIRKLLCELLRLSGFVAQPMASGVEALGHLDTVADDDMPALVLLDVQMPEMDGWSTLQRIRSNHRVRDVRVVLCTVKASDEDLDRGWSLGCDGYVAKPFAIAELVREVHAVLDRPEQERAAHRWAARQALVMKA